MFFKVILIFSGFDYERYLGCMFGGYREFFKVLKLVRERERKVRIIKKYGEMERGIRRGVRGKRGKKGERK